MTNPSPVRIAAPRLAQRWQPWYVLAILALPVLVLWHGDDVLFTPPSFTDPWYYLGYFRTLIDFKRELFPDAYFGSRLSWILPGFVLHTLFTPLIANFILHVGMHSIASVSLFSILRRTASSRTAFLATMVFSVNPWLWAATGWDYVNGAGIAYWLLTMAALTHAAEQPDSRRSLITAGASIAGMVYAHFLWLSFVPLLGLYYAGLVWTWHRLPPLQLARRSTPGLVLGFGLVTAGFSAANYAMNGTLWFYGASWRAAMRAPEVFTTAPSVYVDQALAPWLWFPLMASAAALVLVLSRLRKGTVEAMSPALLFSLQLLLALAWMAYLQSRDIAMLGFYHYAAYLIPFAFLTAGSLLWGAVDRMSKSTYVLTCGAAAVGFAAVWYQPANGWVLPAWQMACLGGLPLAAGLALNRRPVGTWLALGGLLVLSAHAARATASLHGTREEYRRITAQRDNIERDRKHDSVRFWFDQNEPGSAEYSAMNSLYLDKRLGLAFPRGGCEVQVLPGTLIVVPSAKANAAELARQALSDCWRGAAMKPVLLAADRIDRKGSPYTVTRLRAEKDLSAHSPLRTVIAPDGRVSLEITSDSAPAPLPPDRWKKESPDAVLAAATQGIDVRTPRGDYDYTMSYPQLTVPETGRYRFALRYSRGAGEFAFGAFPADNSHWLAESTIGYRNGDDREIAFTVDLKAGESVILRIANNNNYRDRRPASFRMLDVTATLAR